MNISQLEKANAQNKFPLSNGSGVLEFSLLSAGDFTIGSNVVRANPHATADVVATPAPGITAVPPAAPTGISDSAILIRKYDDLLRVWARNGGTWAHVFDYV